ANPTIMMPSTPVGAPRPLASQHPPFSGGQQYPLPLPSSRQSRPLGQAFMSVGAQVIVHLLSLPLLPHVVESQSVFPAQVSPSPVGVNGVMMQAFAKQLCVDWQSPSVSQYRCGTCARMNAFSASTRVSAPYIWQV